MLKKQFEHDLIALSTNPQMIITVVKLPTGAKEVIVNTEKLSDKAEYLLDVYNDDFKLEKNPEISIIGYLII